MQMDTGVLRIEAVIEEKTEIGTGGGLVAGIDRGEGGAHDQEREIQERDQSAVDLGLVGHGLDLEEEQIDVQDPVAIPGVISITDVLIRAVAHEMGINHSQNLNLQRKVLVVRQRCQVLKLKVLNNLMD